MRQYETIIKTKKRYKATQTSRVNAVSLSTFIGKCQEEWNKRGQGKLNIGFQCIKQSWKNIFNCIV